MDSENHVRLYNHSINEAFFQDGTQEGRATGQLREGTGTACEDGDEAQQLAGEAD